jgi:hypothetical protein
MFSIAQKFDLCQVFVHYVVHCFVRCFVHSFVHSEATSIIQSYAKQSFPTLKALQTIASNELQTNIY